MVVHERNCCKICGPLPWMLTYARCIIDWYVFYVVVAYISQPNHQQFDDDQTMNQQWPVSKNFGTNPNGEILNSGPNEENSSLLSYHIGGPS